MTTVAYRDGILACDRLMYSSGLKEPYDGKLAIVDDRTAIAVTGSISGGLMFMEWYKNPLRKEEDFPVPRTLNGKTYFTAIVVTKEDDGTIEAMYWDDILMPIPCRSNFHAEGCGRDVAYGAMSCGADARDAVAAANVFCAESGYGVMSVDMSKEVLEIRKRGG